MHQKFGRRIRLSAYHLNGEYCSDPLFRMVTGRGSPCPSTVGPKCFRWLQTRNVFSSPPRIVGAGDKVRVFQDF